MQLNQNIVLNYLYSSVIISNVRLRFCKENAFSGHLIAVMVRRHVLKLSSFIFDFAAEPSHPL